jgi:hypothetical protein
MLDPRAAQENLPSWRDVVDPGSWQLDDLIDPRGAVLAEAPSRLGGWPVTWRNHTVGLLDNSKANARFLLEEARSALAAAAPGLTFSYVRKMSASEGIEETNLEKLVSVCDAVILASAD